MKAEVFKIALIVLLSLATFCPAQNKNTSKVRPPAVSGSFYPADKTSLEKQLSTFFENVDDKAVEENAAAIIVPHAGYIFSGQVAATAYAKIDPAKQYKRIFIIGTSHHEWLNGASVYNAGDFQTPLGIVKVDTELAKKLIDEIKFIKYSPGAHDREHSIEVQLPFLQYHLQKPFEIVPIIISTNTAVTCKKIAETLMPYFNDENLFVISSDFSHYPDYADAEKVDKITGDAVASNSPEKFADVINNNAKENIPGLATSCCGWSSVLTLLLMTSQTPGIEIEHLKYLNSGDTPYGDKQKVVGYHSFIFTRNNAASYSLDFSLDANEKETLLKLARKTIIDKLSGKPVQHVNEKEISPALLNHCGAFVTLTKNDQLRGCIGRFMADEPLYKIIQDMALSSAFNDYRFSPVTGDEMKDIEIEISVLTPLKRIYSADDFELGKHGIYMIKGSCSGTYLPQVAEETGWTKEEFLSHCARDKAGIGKDGWKEADLYTYEALIFSEKEFKARAK